MRIAVGLSGGVDSAVAAYLLKQKGFDITGVYLSAWCNKQAREDRESARQVAKFLGIDFKVLDIREEYKQKVINVFFDEYKHNRVPSPDIICNQEIKFGLFLDWALKQDYQKVATGHYAKLKFSKHRPAIYRPVDKTKDQTYFLYRLTESVLDHIIWPLGDKTKTQVRQLAGRINLPNQDRPESMGICFVGEVDILKFLSQRLPVKVGQVILPTGQAVGEHKGVWFYSLGQRHGFRVQRPANLPKKFLRADGSLKPLYIIKKNMKTNKLIVSVKEDCMITEITLSNLHTIWADEINQLEPVTLKCRLRNLGRLYKAGLKRVGRYWQVRLDQPAFITSPGQSVVFYNPDNRLIGGGVVEEVGR